jgi:hypothetical protein
VTLRSYLSTVVLMSSSRLDSTNIDQCSAISADDQQGWIFITVEWRCTSITIPSTAVRIEPGLAARFIAKYTKYCSILLWVGVFTEISATQ